MSPCSYVHNNQIETFPTLSSNNTLKGWVVSVLTLGAMIGALINGPVADRLSRRWSICLAGTIFMVGTALQAAAVNVPMMFIGRFIAGVSIGMLSMVVPLYISELAPPNLRGALVSLQQLGITVGIMVAFWLDYGTTYIKGADGRQSPAAWRLPLALQCALALVLTIGSTILPYSPRWLMLKDREEEAVQVLVRIRQVGASDWRLQREILEIKAASTFDRQIIEGQYPAGMSPFRIAVSQYLELITVPHLRRRLRIACLLQVIQQFTGINAIIYYAPTIFQDIGLSGNSVNLLATGVVGIINFIMTWPAILFLDRVGRRTILVAGGVGMAIAQLVVATIYAVNKDKWAANKSAGWAAAVFIWVYIANFAYSIGCVNWVMPSELFPPAKRAKAVGVAIGTNWFSNVRCSVIGAPTRYLLTVWLSSLSALLYHRCLLRLLTALSTSSLVSCHDPSSVQLPLLASSLTSFLPAFCLILIAWVIFLVPETRGVRIEDMDRVFGGSDGEAEQRLMSEIRRRLGLDGFAEDVAASETKGETVQHFEAHE